MFRNTSNFLYCTVVVFAFILFQSCKSESKSDAEHAYTNDLVYETSPYLLQHSHNPVNWRAWSPEVLAEAKTKNKLLLISIGYSSCHWCHVMEKETFEDLEVAELMNQNFINIKVDREERPDVDQVYQTAIQLIGQGGGWPLNVIALPNGKPLYLGTYLPKKQWTEVLSKVNQMYTDDPVKANEYSDQLALGIQETNVLQPSSEFEKLTPEALKSGVEKWKQNWDLELGGNQGREKFMVPGGLNFLLDYAVLNDDKATLNHVKNTLDKMANGGLFDHLGGGFYRYSTDSKWKVPHFEKMLYDNAQALSLYSKAYTIFREPLYKEVVSASAAFLDREMNNGSGGYYATLNADSEGEEGKFYVWEQAELEKVLGEDFRLFSNYYNIEEGAAWEEGKYILHTSELDEDFLKKNNLTPEELAIKKNDWKSKLLMTRDARVRPTTDDKIITSWNALLISGFVDAYIAFKEPFFLERAISIFNFIRSNSYSKGDLLHSYKKDSKRKEGFLEDYAFLIDASLKLYEVTLNDSYLKIAKELTQIVQQDFSDEASGMYAFSKEKNLISKIIKTNDGDIPSPNSIMAQNLFRIGHIDYNVDYLNQSKTMLTTVLPYVTEYTDGYAEWARLLQHTTQPFFEIAIVGKDAEQLVAEMQANHLPNTLIVGSTKESEAPLFKDRYFDDETFIYVCQNSTCKLPVKSVSEALNQMKNF